jgi:3-deoxy-manno-octulosonate cytidylyltransferase (CMP-KDO synthetase)
MARAIAVIPARYASTRLPGKPLLDICGKTMLQRVWEAASDSRILHRIIVATDDERIAKHCYEIGAEFILTPSDIQSGTDRVIYTYKKLGEIADLILNIQGDEPLITGDLIDDIIITAEKTESDVVTLITKFDSFEELFEPSNVKVVFRPDNTAIYFSRSVIPYIRDIKEIDWIEKNDYWKHIGIYAYRKKALFDFERLGKSNLENLEKLEQLRLLEAGATFYCLKTDLKLMGVDTPEDLKEVRRFFKMVEGY